MRGWRTVALVAVVAAGCYRPDPPDCAITCAAGFCPEGLTCSNQFCVAEPTTICTGAPDGGPDGPPGPDGLPGPDGPPADDASTIDLTTGVCTDGILNFGEECDDGNPSDDDACTNVCTWARCGDGIVRPSVEECDDDNVIDDDACSNSCLECAGASEYSYPGNGHCYWRSGTTDLYVIARGTCVAGGGHLLTYTSTGEAAAVHNALVATQGETWLGLTDEIFSGTIRWETEEPLTYTNWGTGQPDVNNYAVQEITGMWFMSSGVVGRGYVCEREPWFVRPTDGHAYRIFYDAQTWNEAASGCAGWSAHLAVIESDAERVFLMGQILLARTTTGMIDRGAFWIGANDLSVEGAFQWEDGTPVAFSPWEAGAPDDGGGLNEDCLSVWGDTHEWNDRGCVVPLPYLCEIDD